MGKKQAFFCPTSRGHGHLDTLIALERDKTSEIDNKDIVYGTCFQGVLQ